MVGDVQRPAVCISTTEAQAAASDCAAPIRSECPETRPSTPAARARRVMIARTVRTPRRADPTTFPVRTRRNIGPSASSAAASQARTRRTVGAPTLATAPSPSLVSLRVPDGEPPRAILLKRDICDRERGDLRDAEHCVGRDRDDGRVAKSRERAPLGERGREVCLVPSHARELAPAVTATFAPESGEDPGGGRAPVWAFGPLCGREGAGEGLRGSSVVGP